MRVWSTERSPADYQFDGNRKTSLKAAAKEIDNDAQLSNCALAAARPGRKASPALRTKLIPTPATRNRSYL